MSKRTFVIMDTSNEGYNLDYDVTVEDTDNGTLYSMYRSRSGYWDESAKGEKVMSILDDGDGMVISPRVAKSLDYAEVAELFALLSFINSQEKYGLYKGEILETKLVKTI